MWETGYAVCRVCQHKIVAVLEMDPDRREWKKVRANMECSNCGNQTVNFVEQSEFEDCRGSAAQCTKAH